MHGQTQFDAGLPGPMGVYHVSYRSVLTGYIAHDSEAQASADAEHLMRSAVTNKILEYLLALCQINADAGIKHPDNESARFGLGFYGDSAVLGVFNCFNRVCEDAISLHTSRPGTWGLTQG